MAEPILARSSDGAAVLAVACRHRRRLVNTHGSVAVVPVVRGLFVLRGSIGAPSDFLTAR